MRSHCTSTWLARALWLFALISFGCGEKDSGPVTGPPEVGPPEVDPPGDDPPDVVDGGWWDGFGQDNAPDGVVRHLAALRDRLVIAGDFTKVGSLPASGMAFWDGTAWSAPAPPPEGVHWLLAEGDILVAGGPALGFRRWSGTDWVEAAPARSDAVASALKDGLVHIATGDAGTVERYRDGRWEVIASPSPPSPSALAPRIRAYGLAVCGGDIHVALDRIEGMMWFQTAVVARVRNGGYDPELEIGGQDNTSSGIDHLNSADGQLIAAWSFGSPGGNADGVECWLGGVTRRTLASNLSLLVRGSNVLDGSFYLADFHTVLVTDPGQATPESLGTVESGEILDAESFEGSVFVCGTFTGISGVESFHLARWTP